MRLCFGGFCLGHQRPLAVEQGSQTALTLSSAIDNYNITTFINRAAAFNEEKAFSNRAPEMLAQNDSIIENNTMEPSLSNESELDTRNNNIFSTPPNVELAKSEAYCHDATAGALGSMVISETSNHTRNDLENKMASREMELIRVIQTKDLQIKELEERLHRKDEEIANLRSHLDKFQSVFPFSRSTGVIARKMGRNIQRQRATGISAEPSQNSMLELLNVAFPKYEKQER